MSNDLNKAGLEAAARAVYDALPNFGWERRHEDCTRQAEAAIRAYLADLSARQSPTEPDIIEATAKNRSSLYVDLSAAPPVAVHETPVGETQADLPSMGGVIANLRSDAAQLLRMSEATRFGEDMSVRVKDPALLIASLVAAADALSSAQSSIQRAERERDALRDVVSKCAAALPNGAFIAPGASIEFMQRLPGEIASVIASLGEKQDAE